MSTFNDEENQALYDAKNAVIPKIIVEESSTVVESVEFEDKSALASFPASYINLVKTIIGAGILVLPSALISFGLFLGLFMMFIAAAFCILGLHLINVSSASLGRKANFSGLCTITYPKAAFSFELAIVVKCIGAGISYLSIIGTTSADLATQLLVPRFSENSFGASLFGAKAFWTLLMAAIITPVCLMRKMDSLKYTSFGGLLAVLYLVCLTIWNALNSPTFSLANIPVFAPFSYAMFSAYSVFVFAFTCHQNILPIQNEARNHTPKGMMNIIGSSVGTAGVLYLAVAVFGAATYGDKVEKVILKSFPADKLPFIIARFMYVFLLILSFPLQVFPCRISVEKMTLSLSPRLMISKARFIYFVSTFIIIFLCAGIGALNYDVGKALSWVGATSGTFICYFLPAIIYNKLNIGKPMDWRRIAALALFMAGCLTLVLAVTGLILG